MERGPTSERARKIRVGPLPSGQVWEGTPRGTYNPHCGHLLILSKRARWKKTKTEQKVLHTEALVGQKQLERLHRNRPRYTSVDWGNLGSSLGGGGVWERGVDLILKREGGGGKRYLSDIKMTNTGGASLTCFLKNRSWRGDLISG